MMSGNTICVSERDLSPTSSTNDRSKHIDRLCSALARKDFIYLSSDKYRMILSDNSQMHLSDWEAFAGSWDDLHLDTYMADGGKYRKRRYATLSAPASSTQFKLEPHQPHFQSLNYNSLNGGVSRHFEPIELEVVTGPTMSSLLSLGCEVFCRLAPYTPWHIEVHQFRIEAEPDMPGNPTPEGVHRDGVNFILMAMVRRSNLVNGTSAIYDLDKNKLDEFTLQQPLEIAMVNDERVFHGVTPVVPLDPTQPSTRDVLVITFRRKA